MRTDTVPFALKNQEVSKRPRYVIELSFDSDNTILWYFTSHSDSALPSGGVSSILEVVEGMSGTSQTLKPDEANAGIGNISFSLVDKASIVTDTLGSQLTLGRSTRRQRVRVYVGFEGLAWADYTLVQTQLVTQIDFEDGQYKFTCADIQREMRKDIFELAKTNLAAAVALAATTVEVTSTAAFQLLTHGNSYSDSPNATVGYIKVEDEVIKYTGKTSTQFTGCVRGALNTRAAEHAVDLAASLDRRTAVEEYVYLELPAVKAIHALLTGGMPEAPIGDTITATFDSSLWVAGQTPAGYSLNQDIAGESAFAVRVGPDGYSEVVNVCQSLDTPSGDPGADGGWEMGTNFPADKTKAHLFAVWMKRLSTGLNTNGQCYWGLHTNSGSDVLDLGGSSNTNPYMVSGAIASVMPTADKWYLLVGFVHENGYGSTDTLISGSYDPETGTKVLGGLEFKWPSDMTAVRHRSYHYYNQEISGEIQQMARPRVFECTVADAPAMIASLLSVAARLPTAWHLGIAPSYIRKADFTNKYDLYDWKDDRKGFVVRFEGLEKSDGKKFIESELALLTGGFMPVYADGALGFRRMANILAGAAYVKVLDDSNLVRASRLTHDFGALRNVIQISWNWEAVREDFTRVNLLIDSASVTVHGKADPLKLKFRGLHGSRHTSVALAQRFDAIRDRYSNPPLRTQVTVLPSLNSLEVGDVVRLKPTKLRDFVANDPLDRSFEVQNISIDWITGNVALQLFGSSEGPSEIAPTSDPTALPNSWYTSEGTALSSLVTISGSSPGHVTAGGTLTGSANSAASVFYYDGDLVIDAGVTINVTNNVQLRIKGFLQNNGTINGKGNGLGGGAAVSPATFRGHHNPGTPGFLGTPIAGGGLAHGATTFFSGKTTSYEGARTFGLNTAVPGFNLGWDGVVLSGLPPDLRGSSGASGMPAEFIGTTFSAGGSGGSGGAGLIIISRGFAQGAAGKVDLSGGNGGVGGSIVSGTTFHAGGGAGGAPGGLLIVLDGASASATGLTELGAVADYGLTPITGTPLAAPFVVTPGGSTPAYSFFVGNGNGSTFPVPSLSGGRGGSRVQYIPADSDAEADLAEATLTPPSNFGLAAGTPELFVKLDGTIAARIKATWTASPDGRVLAYDLQFKPSSESVWVSVPTVFGRTETTTLFPVPKDGVNWDARVRSAGADRTVSDWVTITGFFVDGKATPPTNVGALAFTDPILSWSDLIDPDLAGYIVRYNPGSDTTWVSATPAHEEGFITETNFDTGNIVGGQTTLLVKGIDSSGNESAAAASLVVDLRPAQITSFNITRQPDGTREFSWATNVLPTDFDGARIRYFLGTTSDWAAMTPLHSGVLKASPFESNQLAAGVYTFAAKNVDKAGNESANATFITTVTVGDPRIAGAVEDQVEQPVWAGTKTDCHVDLATGWLVADGSATWTTLPSTWTGWTKWNHTPDSPITYEVLIDLGVKLKFIPLVTVVGDGSQTLEEQHSDDGSSYTSYAAVGPQVDARYIRIRVTMTGSYPVMKSMRTILSASPISEIIEDQDSASLTGAYDLGVGDIRIPITKVYSIIKKVDVTLQSVGAGWSWELIDKDETVGPRIKIYNSSNTLADAVFDATVTGI